MLRSAHALDRRCQPESGQREFACGREHGEIIGSLRHRLPAGCDCDALSPLWFIMRGLPWALTVSSCLLAEVYTCQLDLL